MAELAFNGIALDAEEMQDLREVLARIEGELSVQRQLLTEVRDWMMTYRRPVSGMEERFARLDREVGQLRERVVSLETRSQLRLWLVGLMAGSGSGVAMWILSQLLR